MNKIFELDAKLEKDSVYITKLKLCQIRLINNADYQWLILIPELPDIVEITDLTDDEYLLLNQEIRQVTHILQTRFNPGKINIGIIGNIVRQMHVHIICRYANDKLFPNPVWGHSFTPYASKELTTKIPFLMSLFNF